jgi:hypothetical protein
MPKTAETAAEAQARLEQLNPSKNQKPAAPAAAQAEPQADPPAGEPDLRRQYRHLMQPIAPPAPSAERMAELHQHVTVRNTSDRTPNAQGLIRPQVHIVLDRGMVGHTLQPGEAKELDLLVRDVRYFLRQRAPDRRDHYGRPKPLHPIVIEGLSEDAVKQATAV